MTEFSDGTILKEIDRINRHISKKLQISCDLREHFIVKEDCENSIAEAREKKIEEYIKKFVLLNNENEQILDRVRGQFEKALVEQKFIIDNKFNEKM